MSLLGILGGSWFVSHSDAFFGASCVRIPSTVFFGASCVRMVAPDAVVRALAAVMMAPDAAVTGSPWAPGVMMGFLSRGNVTG